MAETFTPGPWRVDPEASITGRLNVVAADGEGDLGIVCRVEGVLGAGPYAEPALANAALIAAAPTMYEPCAFLARALAASTRAPRASKRLCKGPFQ